MPREPFSFGGLEGSRSKFGEHDITGEGGLHFFTRTRKITTALRAYAALTTSASKGAVREVK